MVIGIVRFDQKNAEFRDEFNGEDHFVKMTVTIKNVTAVNVVIF